MSAAPSAARAPQRARFVEGSTMRHVLVMTATSSVGLLTIFLADFADMYFLSLLGQDEVAGAIGYAGVIAFLDISLCVGLMIAMVALVSTRIGAGRAEEARRIAASMIVFTALATAAVAALLLALLEAIFDLLGAAGPPREYGLIYARIILPALPILGVTLNMSGILRALGDARRAMQVTLAVGIVNAVLDPLFIFGFGWGVPGAALGTVAADVAALAMGLATTHRVHGFLVRPSLEALRLDWAPILRVALPAVMTNLATPAGNAYMTAALAGFGPAAVAGFALVGRIVPVAFGAIFSLSGAVGPIVGQNFGAGRLDRVRRIIADALVVTAAYVCAISLILWLAQDTLVALLGASGLAAELIRLFCSWLGLSWVFIGALFVANAVFNNLGRAHYSTAFNWGRATLGTIPLVHLGGQLAGAAGVLIGAAAGSVLFGIAAAWSAFALVRRMEERSRVP